MQILFLFLCSKGVKGKFSSEIPILWNSCEIPVFQTGPDGEKMVDNCHWICELVYEILQSLL
jgi:hypothetical protein